MANTPIWHPIQQQNSGSVKDFLSAGELFNKATSNIAGLLKEAGEKQKQEASDLFDSMIMGTKTADEVARLEYDFKQGVIPKQKYLNPNKVMTGLESRRLALADREFALKKRAIEEQQMALQQKRLPLEEQKLGMEQQRLGLEQKRFEEEMRTLPEQQKLASMELAQKLATAGQTALEQEEIPQVEAFSKDPGKYVTKQGDIDMDLFNKDTAGLSSASRNKVWNSISNHQKIVVTDKLAEDRIKANSILQKYAGDTPAVMQQRLIAANISSDVATPVLQQHQMMYSTTLAEKKLAAIGAAERLAAPIDPVTGIVSPNPSLFKKTLIDAGVPPDVANEETEKFVNRNVSVNKQVASNQSEEFNKVMGPIPQYIEAIKAESPEEYIKALDLYNFYNLVYTTDRYPWVRAEVEAKGGLNWVNQLFSKAFVNGANSWFNGEYDESDVKELERIMKENKGKSIKEWKTAVNEANKKEEAGKVAATVEREQASSIPIIPISRDTPATSDYAIPTEASPSGGQAGFLAPYLQEINTALGKRYEATRKKILPSR